MSKITQTKLVRATWRVGAKDKHRITGYIDPQKRFIVLNENKHSTVLTALVANGELVNWHTRELRLEKKKKS